VCARCLLRGTTGPFTRTAPHSRGRMEIWRSCRSERPGRAWWHGLTRLRSGIVDKWRFMPATANGAGSRSRGFRRVRRRDRTAGAICSGGNDEGLPRDCNTADPSSKRRGPATWRFGCRLMDFALAARICRTAREVETSTPQQRPTYGNHRHPRSRRCAKAARRTVARSEEEERGLEIAAGGPA